MFLMRLRSEPEIMDGESAEASAVLATWWPPLYRWARLYFI
jgi:hypothetical protein